MSENKLYISGLCPYCALALDYSEGDDAVECCGCKNAVPTRILRPLSVECKGTESNSVKIHTGSVTSSRSALIYFDNLCDTYDWKKFAFSPDITIRVAEELAESCKIKFSDDPATYLFDFRRIAIPAFKKLEALKLLEVEIIENYKSDDISSLFEYVDLYSSITAAIERNKDNLIKTLETDVRLAEKFGAEKSVTDDLKKSLDFFKSEVSDIKEVTDIESIPGYQSAKELCDAKLAERLAKAGIDAARTYSKAKTFLDEGDVNSALHLFRVLEGYRDSRKELDTHSGFFEFNELYEMAGKRYVLKDKKPLYLSLDDGAKETYSYSLFEVAYGNISANASVSGISSIIGCFGTRIFYIERDESLCCFDTAAADSAKTVLDEAFRGDFAIDEHHPIWFSRDKSRFFVRKKLHTAQKKNVRMNNDNNFSLLEVNMDEVTCKTVLPEIIDVMDFCDDRIFYTLVTEDGECVFRVYDINAGSSEDILDTGSVIHKCIGNRIIYSVWAPSMYNMDLYSIDITEKIPTLLASNISSYYTAHEGKIFYTVGAQNKRLYSVSAEGGEAKEILDDAGSICTLRSGWIYYISGEGRNACLMKVSTDGTKNVTVASRFRTMIKMTSGYIYYISTALDLRAVRTDGHGDTLIARAVADQKIIVDDERIYYLKREFIGHEDGDEAGEGFCLYSTNLQGKGLIKLAHDVSDITEYDDEHIYITLSRVNKYMVSLPTGKKTFSTEYVSKTVTYYESLEKQTGKRELIMLTGTPEKVFGTYKSGCLIFRRRRREEAVIIKINEHSTYIRSGVASRGYVKGEELEAERRRRERIASDKKASREAKKELKKLRDKKHRKTI